jgi:hypothetical protein
LVFHLLPEKLNGGQSCLHWLSQPVLQIRRCGGF